MNNTLFLFPLLIIGLNVFSYTNNHTPRSISIGANQSRIHWLTWEEAIQQSKIEKRKIIVDIFTNWCHWCKRMDQSTFSDPLIAAYINKNYYAVKFNAEQKEPIKYNGKTYRFVKNGKRGYHELAAELTRGRLSYPTVVFLDEYFQLLQPIPGFKTPSQFEQIITYFGRNEHTRTPWETYQRSYKPLAGQ